MRRSDARLPDVRVAVQTARRGVAGGASARLRGVRGKPLPARRGKPVAIVAVARKLAMLCWKLLITQREYAYQRPTLVARKMRALELTADEPGRRGRQGRAGNLWGVAGASAAAVDLIASQLAEGAYRRCTRDWQAAQPHAAALHH